MHEGDKRASSVIIHRWNFFHTRDSTGKILMKVNVPFHPVKLRLIITGNVLREFQGEIATIFRRQLPPLLKSAFQIDAFRLLQVIKSQ